MKRFIITSMLIGLLATFTSLMAQDQKEDYLGLPGDNLNLYAVMRLFQQSKTLDEFERNLNDANTRINNLDLNGDNIVDYIKVIDNVDGDVHNIVLQDAVNERENQDVAVFTVQRFSNGEVQIQLTGDEELYGKDYIIEPIFDDSTAGQTPNPGYTGDGRNVTVTRTTTLEIAAWPVVRFIYLPGYVTWRSSWYWGYHPVYWHPWHPLYWHYYYGYQYNWYNDYYSHYRRWNNHRYDRWNDDYYRSRRMYSAHVNERIHEGSYKSTYLHPEQKKDGEAMYSRIHQDQNSRRPDTPRGNSQIRRSESRPAQLRQPETTRRTVTRRSETTVTDKPVSNTSTKRAATTTRRTDTRVTGKPNTPQPSEQKAVSDRTSPQTKSTTVKATSRRNAKAGKTAAPAKKEGRTKDAAKKNDRRRD